MPATALRHRFRQHFAIPVAGFIAFVGATALATQRWWLLPLLAVPVVAMWWGLRSGVDADADGLRVRGLLGGRTLRWDDVAGLSVVQQKVYAELNSGESVRLPAVHPHFVPALLSLAGAGGGAGPNGHEADTLET